jgi:uncharacterized repeat protein (TIGR03803 family)
MRVGHLIETVSTEPRRHRADPNGNLFGVTAQGGANNFGTVFEIAKTANGYASTSTNLVSFDGTDGATPVSGLKRRRMYH